MTPYVVTRALAALRMVWPSAAWMAVKMLATCASGLNGTRGVTTLTRDEGTGAPAHPHAPLTRFAAGGAAGTPDVTFDARETAPY